VSFDATDPSGIAAVDVLGPSGGSVEDVQESCDFSQVQACPELPAGQVQVDTLALPDGREHVSLKLANAAGDTTVVQGPAVVVDNNGPSAPSSLTAVAASGTSNLVDLSWSDPANPPEPVQTAYAQLCQASCAAPEQVSTTGGAQVTAPSAGTYTARLWLTDTAGRGSSANAATATVTVPATTTVTTTTSTTTPMATSPPPVPCSSKATCPVFKVRSARWTKGRLSLFVAGLPSGDLLRIAIYYAHGSIRTITTTKSNVTVATRRPARLVLRALRARRTLGPAVTITKLTATTTADRS
jgi:hypothetical protein